MELGFPHLVLLAFMALTFLSGLVWGPEKVIPRAFVLALFFLPPGVTLTIPGPIPALDKMGTVSFPALLLLLVSGRQLVRLQWNLCDTLGSLFILALVAANLAAGKGAYATGSRLVSILVQYLVPYLAGRVWLGEEEEVEDWLPFFFAVATFYVFLMAAEFFLGPFFSHALYGLPREVSPPRFGFYRPMVFFYTPLFLGALMTLTLGLAVAFRIHQKETGRDESSWLPLQIPLFALAVLFSLSRGPILGAFLMLGFFFFFREKTWIPSGALGLAGVVLFLWMVLGGNAWKVSSFLGLEGGELSQTLAYRFQEVDAYASFVQARLWLGWGNPIPRDSWIPIIDGTLLLVIMEGGLLSLGAYTSWILSLIKRAPSLEDHPFASRPLLGAMLAGQTGWLLFTSWGDAFITPFHLFLAGALVSREVSKEEGLESRIGGAGESS